MEPIRIYYFSDILCVWAYVAQVRIDELKSTFASKIAISHHFVPVFGNAREKLENRWRDRGGFPGYSKHVLEVASKYDHIAVREDIWQEVVPHSSTAAHLFLRAIQLLERDGTIDPSQRAFEKTTWAFREAFFTQCRDVSDRGVQMEIADALGLPVAKLVAQIDSGAAYADLSKDWDLVKEHGVSVSPTVIFNEGRQRLNGNVGYRILEANIRELLHNPPNEQSWC